MQKKLIALAVAGLVSGAAFAQSNVTIYGVMDLAQESVKAAGASTGSVDLERRGRLSSNSSYIGFKGSEALGNGLTAVWQYETGFAADTAGALAGGRDTLIGLAGSFGTVAAGTLTHPYRVLGAKVDHNPGASSIGFTGSMYGEVAGIKTGTDDRATNAVAYISPTVSGFHGVIAYVNGETRTAPTAAPLVGAPGAGSVNTKAWQIGLVYDQGPLFVGYAHHNADDATTVAFIDADTKFKADRLAAVYSFGGTKVSALWDKQKANANTASVDLKRTAYMLGVSQTFGANQVYLQYAVAKDLTGSALPALGGTNSDTGAKQITLGYAYNLSKRTVAHAYYSKITNKANAAYDFYVNGVGMANALTAATTNNGADPTGFGLGLRHSF